jgi:hypothetical protein
MMKKKPNEKDCVICEDWDESFGCLRGCKYLEDEFCMYAEEEN